ncbi:hypothetical protein ACH4T9_31530 [Micromonospora sp. NPDC020750]|uniref:hypothetical protein n=1 Tax=unclassified Micromonospora TaxID=2617518 RepID=UPI0037AC0723
MRVRTLLTLLAGPALAGLAACGQPGSAAAPQQPATSPAPSSCAQAGTAVPSPPTPSPGRSYWPHQNSLMDAATTVQEAGEQRWPQVYAGVELDLEQNLLKVRRIPSGPAVDQAVCALVPTVIVRFVDAVHSERQLAAWQARVFADRSYWQRRGIVLNGISTDMGLGVVVAMDDPDRHRAAITARYPGLLLPQALLGSADGITVAAAQPLHCRVERLPR